MFKKRYFLFLFSAIAFSMYFLGCSHSGGSSNVGISKIEITPAAESIVLGTTQQFHATAINLDGSNKDVTEEVSWSSQNTDVAVIDTHGRVTSVSVGNTDITAALGGVTSPVAALSVTAAELISLEVYPTNPSIALGTTQQFTATGIYSNGPKNITADANWTSSDDNVSVISNAGGSEGLVTPISIGDTNITATFGGMTSPVSTLSVTDAELVSIAVTPTNPSIALGTTQQFTATGTYTDTTTQNITTNVTWTSSDHNVSTISNTNGTEGATTTLNVGDTNITATLGDVTSPASTLTVTAATLDSIAVTPANPSTPLGVDIQFTATGTYSDTSTQDITLNATWTSSDNNVTTISNAGGSEGLATPVKIGETNITATLDDMTSPVSTLKVTEAILDTITVTPTYLSTPLGIDVQFTATGTYSDSSTQNITTQSTWASSHPGVAAISNADGAEGIATPVAIGTTNITATFSGETSPTSILEVTAAKLDSIDIDPIAESIPLGENQQFTAEGTYSDGSQDNITDQVTWYSSEESIATISNAKKEKGLATSVAVGTTEINATLEGIVSSVSTLDVTEPERIAIRIEPSNPILILAPGTTQRFTATGIYTDGSEDNITDQVTWASSDTDVAFIFNNPAGFEGYTVLFEEGTTDISAAFEDLPTATTKLTVTE